MCRKDGYRLPAFEAYHLVFDINTAHVRVDEIGTNEDIDGKPVGNEERYTVAYVSETNHEVDGTR